MPRSAPLIALRERRNELRKHFLPRRFSKLGNYTEAQRHLAGAYRVFFNAELENYFEQFARLAAKRAETEWSHGRASRAFAALCSNNLSQTAMPVETTLIKAQGFLSRRFENELEKHRKLVNDNNGAKSHNILRIFVPLGADDSKIDPVLLSECDTLGSGRGLLAHKTGGAAMQLIDPRSEYDRSILIIELLDEFEKLVEIK